ncbi:MAG: hypothetical protein AAF734_03465, partial [Bacteroidota bacterium]
MKLISSEIEAFKTLLFSPKTYDLAIEMSKSTIHLQRIISEMSQRFQRAFPFSNDTFQEIVQTQHLDLSHQSLETLQPAVEVLENLQSLDLSYNQFSYVPTTINKLAYLTSLDLSSNRIQHLSHEINRISVLQVL